MSTLYGIPYMGSKTKIAIDILRQLPSGKRFVDLFGGGFAMSHAAFLTGRYKDVLYNDFNPLIVNLVKGGLKGQYNYSLFQPQFITREEFYEKKETDGYIKYIWSFGNSGHEYMFSKEIEPLKHMAHDFVVFGRFNSGLDKIAPNIRQAVKSSNIHDRRMEFCGFVRRTAKRFDLQQLEQLERLQQKEKREQLERLERLQQFERLERLQQLEQLTRLEKRTITCTNIDSIDYNYQEGDVVYLDPPYENTAEYSGGFEHKKFYDWVATRDYPIWFSSYKNISDNRFKMVYAIRLKSSLGAGNKAVNYECLYTKR